MGSDRLGSGSLAAIFRPLQSPVPPELRPAELSPFPARSRPERRQSSNRFFSAVSAGALPALFRSGRRSTWLMTATTRATRRAKIRDGRATVNPTAIRAATIARDAGDHDERGFFERAGDEVASWFGDEDAERRRREDADAARRSRPAASTGRLDRDYGRGRYDRDDDRDRGRSQTGTTTRGRIRTRRLGERDYSSSWRNELSRSPAIANAIGIASGARAIAR